jgi:hypothetical protein
LPSWSFGCERASGISSKIKEEETRSDVEHRERVDQEMRDALWTAVPQTWVPREGANERRVDDIGVVPVDGSSTDARRVPSDVERDESARERKRRKNTHCDSDTMPSSTSEEAA